MISIPPISRLRAAAIHLAISAAIAALAVTLMLALWYPPPLFGAMGGMALILLIVGVDVAIGPLLTLIVFDTRKKELPFDLAVVAVLQLGALGYGVYAMHAGRPAFIAFVENRFAVVAAAAIEDSALAQARPEFRTRPETGPLLVAVDMPSDAHELNDIFFASLSGLGAQNLPRYYVPYGERLPRVLAAAQPLARLAKLNADERRTLDRSLADLHRSADELRFLPMQTEYTQLTALIDAKSGQLLATVAIRPDDR